MDQNNNPLPNKRRKFLKNLAGGITGYGLIGLSPGIISACSAKTEKQETAATDTTGRNNDEAGRSLFFEISLAEWSLHNALFGGALTNMDFPAKAKNDFGIHAVEYVNAFFKDKAKDQAYLQELKQRTGDLGVQNVLIMIDGEGSLGDLDTAKRKTAVENHYKWVEAAKFLGCHSIRVNAAGQGTAEEVKQAAIEGLGLLTEFGSQHDINIIVENHGGYSSNGKWLADVISQVDNSMCGTLPDFGNFCIENAKEGCLEEYDKYQGVKELMPYAKGVSAKSYDFDEEGNSLGIDYKKMLAIVKDAGYKGHIGIEYEGKKLSEDEGIRATKKLLEKVGSQMA